MTVAWPCLTLQEHKKTESAKDRYEKSGLNIQTVRLMFDLGVENRQK